MLVIEDDEDVRESMRECLVGAGFYVEVAPDSIAALELLPEWIPDLIVLDFTLPHISRQQFVDECRKLPGLARVPVLLNTAGVDVHREREAGRLIKPLDMGQLLEAVRFCLSMVADEGVAGSPRE